MESSRPVLSCGSCRQRKLKCDRSQPCANCVTRSAECVYSSAASRGRPSSQRRDGGNNINMENRLRRLEQLINTMATQMPQQQGGNDGNSSLPVQGHQAPPSSSTHDNVRLHSAPSEPSEVRPGRMMSSDVQVAYVSATHWAALCNEVAELREGLEQSNLADHTGQVDHGFGAGPMLLEGLQRPPELKDILAYIPAKEIVNRLLSRYFSANVVSIVILHAPTFEKEYARFWEDQEKALPAWVGLLYGIMAMGVFLYMRSQEELPGDLGNPMEVLEAFQRRSTECLLLSNYSTAPGPYTMEALAMNAQIEFVRRRDASVGVWVLIGVAIRLALRMGYHRDPSHYPQLSAFQGEMRRRIWAITLQLDALTSCQIGLPPMIQLAQCDTQLPRNLLDEDFGPDSSELPPSRPETALTPVLYTINKTRMSNTFRSIFNHVGLGRVDSYDHIIELDHRLTAAKNELSPRFQMKSFEESISTPPHMLIHCYSLELLSLKARCILHRDHMTQSYANPAYNYSRMSCVEAAMGILKYHMEILQEVQDGGRLCQHKWFLSSLELHDFLLSSMVVCLELSFRKRRETPPLDLGHGQEEIPTKFSRDELAAAVKRSQTFLDELKVQSNDARKASNALSVIVKKFSESGTTNVSRDEQFAGSDSYESNDSSFPLHPIEAEALVDPTYFESAQILSEPMQTSHPAFSSSLEGVESFLNTPDIVDWDQWEAFIQGSRSADSM